MSKLTQIPLDFGQEPPSQPTPPSDGKAPGADTTGQYLAADGVGVRIKSYKRTLESPSLEKYAPARVVNGDLFGAETDGAGMPSDAGEGATRNEGGAQDEGATRDEGATQDEGGTRDMGATRAAVGEGSLAEMAAVMTGKDGSYVANSGPMTVDDAAEAPARPVARKVRKPVPKKGPSKRGRKSLKQVAAEADLIDIPADEVLFSKQYYTMGEVSEMFRVNQSLLRFWETEFDILQPRKNKKGDRYFRPIDIKNLHLIYHLLRQKKYTIEGAKDFLKKNKKAEERFEVIQRLQQIKAFLLEWKAQL